MTFATAKYIEMKQAFGKGLIDNVNPWLLEDGASAYMRNARVTGYDVSIRKGHQLFATLGSTSRPYGMTVYNRNVAANTKMIVRYNYSSTEKLVQVDLTTGAVTPITTASNITVNGRTFFQNGLDVLYVMNGTDLFGKLSGTTYSTITTNVPANFAPKFACMFNGSMWASGWSTNPGIVYKSVGKNYEDFSSTGSDSFTFTGTITGLAATNQSIFYFTADNVWATSFTDITQSGTTVSYFNRPVQTQEGCVAQSTIVTAGDNLYYLTPTAKIMQITRGQQLNGFETQNLSHRPYNGISNFMNTLDPDQSEAFGFYISEQNLVKYYFKTRGSSFNNVSVVYDIEKDCFMIDSNKYWYDWIYINEQAYAASSIEPKIFKCEIGQDDDDMPIAFDYRTKIFNDQAPTLQKMWWEVRTGLQMNPLAIVTQEIYIDNVLVDTITVNGSNLTPIESGIGTQAMGTQAIGNEYNENLPEMQDVQIIRPRGALRKKGKSLQVRWYCNSIGAKLSLQGLDIKREVLPASTSNKTTTYS